MKSKETDYAIYNSLVEIQKERTYTCSLREEECHGFHTFIDQDVLSEEVVRVILRVNGNNIDITERLTKEELALLKLECDEVEVFN